MVRGPANFDAWVACWLIFRACMIMLNAASPATFDFYERGIRKLHKMFPNRWGMLMVADELVRLEQWSVLQEEAILCAPAGYDPKKPWNTLIRNSVYGNPTNALAQWWYDNFVFPADHGGSAKTWALGAPTPPSLSSPASSSWVAPSASPTARTQAAWVNNKGGGKGGGKSGDRQNTHGSNKGMGKDNSKGGEKRTADDSQKTHLLRKSKGILEERLPH